MNTTSHNSRQRAQPTKRNAASTKQKTEPSKRSECNQPSSTDKKSARSHRSAARYSVEKAAMRKSPAAPRGRKMSISCPCKESEHGNAITFTQQCEILQRIEDSKYRDFFTFCCCTGMRVCEALSVKTRRIDRRRGVIHIDMPDTRTKKHRRDVPFLPELFEGMAMGKQYLFEQVTDDGSEHYFNRLYKDLGYALTRHSTRHTFISVLAHLGVDSAQIRDWVGHKNVKMTTDTYTHKLDEGASPILSYLKKLKKSLHV